jgi:hypothetical protein
MTKPFFAEGTPPMMALENMVDRVGLANVLYALGHICNAKANHIEENWQDQITAKAWLRDARKLDRWAAQIEAMS